jgi:cell division protein ZapD
MIHYEYPLGERIRTLLRLEDLFDRFAVYSLETAVASHHAALLTLFEIVDVAARADLKSDLLQELERQKTALLALRGNPRVEGDTLEGVIDIIDDAHQGIFHMPGKIGQHLRDDDWLMAIKQRAVIPGGLCEFDLPAYHHWRHQPSAERRRHLQRWTEPFSSIREAVAIVLKLLRESGQSELQSTPQGAYQRMLEGRNPQMIRVSLADGLPYVPEISANKHALNIRFVHAGPGPARGCIDRTIEFGLTFCTL